MKKIVIVGCAGSGKSTLARQLGTILGLEVIHLDAFYWKPNWVKTTEAEWRETVRTLIEGDAWVMDGNFSSSRDLRFAAADTIVFLDFPRLLCLWRVVQRRFQSSSRLRPDRASGCPEQLNAYLFRHIWRFPHRIRPSLMADLETYASERRIYHLQSSAAVRQFLNHVGR